MSSSPISWEYDLTLGPLGRMHEYDKKGIEAEEDKAYLARVLKYYPELKDQILSVRKSYSSDRQPYSCKVTLKGNRQYIFVDDPTSFEASLEPIYE